MTIDSDAVKKVELRRMKIMATALLVLSVIVFVVSSKWGSSAGWVGYVRAAAEAAMVGALADWFAVTALFRHPLGLPIPHTAIVQKRKDQIGSSLGVFVRDNFLTKSVLRQRLSSVHPSEKLADWLTQPANVQSVGKQSSVVLSGVDEILQDDVVQAALEKFIVKKVDDIPTAVVAGKALDVAISGGHHQVLFESGLKSFGDFMEENAEVFRDRLHKESPWWVPATIDNKVFTKIYDAVGSFIQEILADPLHQVRVEFDIRVRRLSEDLKNSPELAEKAEVLKGQVLGHPEVATWVSSLWVTVKDGFLEASRNPDSEFRRYVESSLLSAGKQLQGDHDLQNRIDGWVIDSLGYVAEEFKGEVSGLISSTVSGWDASETAERLELQVGKDLQYIRINGTIIGGLAGLVIHAVSELLL